MITQTLLSEQIFSRTNRWQQIANFCGFVAQVLTQYNGYWLGEFEDFAAEILKEVSEEHGRTFAAICSSSHFSLPEETLCAITEGGASAQQRHAQFGLLKVTVEETTVEQGTRADFDVQLIAELTESVAPAVTC